MTPAGSGVHGVGDRPPGVGRQLGNSAEHGGQELPAQPALLLHGQVLALPGAVAAPVHDPFRLVLGVGDAGQPDQLPAAVGVHLHGVHQQLDVGDAGDDVPGLDPRHLGLAHVHPGAQRGAGQTGGPAQLAQGPGQLHPVRFGPLGLQHQVPVSLR